MDAWVKFGMVFFVGIFLYVVMELCDAIRFWGSGNYVLENVCNSFAGEIPSSVY